MENVIGEAMNFLTPEECLRVDAALLSSREKFSARVAIYALRSLKAVSAQSGEAIAHLKTHQIVEWINQDQSLQQAADPSFRAFFAQLVDSARRPLAEAAQQVGVPIEALEVDQVIAWFEQVSQHSKG